MKRMLVIISLILCAHVAMAMTAQPTSRELMAELISIDNPFKPSLKINQLCVYFVSDPKQGHCYQVHNDTIKMTDPSKRDLPIQRVVLIGQVNDRHQATCLLSFASKTPAVIHSNHAVATVVYAAGRDLVCRFQ